MTTQPRFAGLRDVVEHVALLPAQGRDGSAIVARAAAVRDVTELPLRVWRHNRAAQLVGFRIDTPGRVYAEGWVAKAGLTAEDFQFVLRRVAAESDRFEFILTGKDVE